MGIGKGFEHGLAPWSNALTFGLRQRSASVPAPRLSASIQALHAKQIEHAGKILPLTIGSLQNERTTPSLLLQGRKYGIKVTQAGPSSSQRPIWHM
jgi:hypothetical protein